MPALYTASVNSAVVHNVLGNPSPTTAVGQSTSSATIVRQIVQSFGKNTSLQFLFRCTAAVPGVDYGEVAKHVPTPNIFPGGYNVIFFETSVEEYSRAAIGELACGQYDFLFASRAPENTPLPEESALLVWRCELHASEIAFLADITFFPDLSATQLSRAVALRACYLQLLIFPGVSEAAVEGDCARDFADAAASASEAAAYAADSADAVESSPALPVSAEACFSAAPDDITCPVPTVLGVTSDTGIPPFSPCQQLRAPPQPNPRTVPCHQGRKRDSSIRPRNTPRSYSSLHLCLGRNRTKGSFHLVCHCNRSIPSHKRSPYSLPSPPRVPSLHDFSLTPRHKDYPRKL